MPNRGFHCQKNIRRCFDYKRKTITKQLIEKTVQTCYNTKQSKTQQIGHVKFSQ